jgi:predicted metal-dependent peptidase
MDDTLKKIERAKLRLILNKQPFFGVLFAHLKPVRVDDPAVVGTMATDGSHLYYHPPFVESLDEDEMMFVAAHEVMHDALEHHIRRRERDPKKWNMAADYAINGTLIEAKIGKMPEGGLHDPSYAGMSAEEIYARMPDPPKDGGGSKNGNDPGGCGGVIDGAAPHDEAKQAELRAATQIRVRQAANLSKARNAGVLPGYLQRLVDEITAPKVNWADELRRLVARSLSITEATWSRPNRRHLHAGLYLPGVIANGIDELVVAVDTSGSIWSEPEILAAFTAEVAALLDGGQIDRIHVVYADAEVKKAAEYARGDIFKMEAVGGGGTAFSDTFAWVKENVPNAAAVIYLTDLYVYDFGEEPSCPVIWTMWGTAKEFAENSAKTPFGDAVHIQP